jgi:hypothetical protein
MTDIPLDDNGAPDLQRLVRQVGGYNLITPAIWKAYDEAMAAYQNKLRRGLRSNLVRKQSR